ncbi:MAG: tyrosine-type recombinase/integrase [Acidobacteriaceae bacterium]|jgi:integrase
MSLSPSFSLQPDLPPLPPTVVTKDRQIVDTSNDIWRFRVSNDGGKVVAIDWSSLDRRVHLGPRSCQLCKLYIARKLQFSKGHTIRSDFGMFHRVLRWMAANNYLEKGRAFGWGVLDHQLFRLYLEHGMSTGEKGNDFARLRDFYAWGAFVGQFPEFDRQLALSIKEIRARGNVKGAAVRFHHPTKGPLDAAEQRIVIDSVRTVEGAPEDRAVLMIHLELGPNPQSIVRLKVRDLEKFEVKTVEAGRSRTHTRYQLALPRVKKRTEHRETVTRPISNELGRLLDTLKKDDPDSFLFHWLNEDDPESDARRAMQRFANECDLISTRTGARLQLSPRRFRYTIGTEMAREGASPEKIASVLDHTDLQNVNVYVEASSYVVDQVGNRFDQLFEQVARRFRGKIVDRPEDAAPAKQAIPSVSAHLPLLNVGGIGMCGRDVRTDGLCNLAPPITCYGCEFFAAFRDGPHEEVLRALEGIQADLKTSSDLRIPMQLDNVIAAARQLVAQIQSKTLEGK